MKKSFKKAGVAVLSMAMLLSMGAMAMPVSAVAGDALTVNVADVTCGSDTVALTGVKIYQVAKRNADTGKWVWNAPFTGAEFKDLESYDASQLNQLAVALKEITTTEDVSNTLVSSTNNTAIADVAGGVSVEGEGYYLIVPTVADNDVVIQPTLMVIDSTGTAVTNVKPKANPLPLTKQITATTDGEISQGTDPSDTSVGIVGSVVEYKITSQLPEYDENVLPENIQNFVLTDDPSDGIKIKNDDADMLVAADGANLKVSIDGTDKTDAVTIAKEGDGFTVTVNGATVNQYQGKSIVVTFKATITEDAVTGNDSCADAAEHQNKTGNPNTAKLTWGNNYSTGGYADPTNPPEKKSTVTTYVGQVTLLKQGNKDGTTENLANAEFTLTGPADFGTKTGLKSDSDGLIDFGYLPAGTYTLTETKAPAGYQTIGSTYQFTVKNKSTATATEFDTFEVDEKETVENVVLNDISDETNKSVAQIVVTDPPADTLPGTGGIGTYLFTFGGVAIVLLAGVLFVVYMKRKKTEE